MKYMFVFLLALTLEKYAEAQIMDTIVINSKAKKFKSREHILIIFEVVDTLDMHSRKVSFTRSYYFNKEQRMISSVREYYNAGNPRKSKKVIYSFRENRLTKVTIVPPKSECLNCSSEYYYAGDSIIAKKERVHTDPDPGRFVRQAQSFQAKVPRYLPWGYFDDETIVNGKMKKLKRRY